jgi:hypothetical protein
MAQTLGLMFGAHPDRVSSLANWCERNLACDLCATEATDLLQERVERFPAPKSVLGVYREVNDSPRHAMHVGQNVRAIAVGKTEAFWHTDGARVIEAKVRDHDLALFIAAQMWWQNVIPTVNWVAEEMASSSIWEDGARSFLAGRGGLDEELLAKTWYRARKMATEGDEKLTGAEIALA